MAFRYPAISIGYSIQVIFQRLAWSKFYDRALKFNRMKNSTEAYRVFRKRV